MTGSRARYNIWWEICKCRPGFRYSRGPGFGRVFDRRERTEAHVVLWRILRDTLGVKSSVTAQHSVALTQSLGGPSLLRWETLPAKPSMAPLNSYSQTEIQALMGLPLSSLSHHTRAQLQFLWSVYFLPRIIDSTDLDLPNVTRGLPHFSEEMTTLQKFVVSLDDLAIPASLFTKGVEVEGSILRT